VLSVGSPGSTDGPRFTGVELGLTAPSAVGAGDASGFCGKASSSPLGLGAADETGVAPVEGAGSSGKACIPALGVETADTTGVAAGDEVESCAKARGPAFGLEAVDGVGASARSGQDRFAVRHPTAIKRIFTGRNL
jgi:hypothetical protein